jgi:hypothetical protein
VGSSRGRTSGGGIIGEKPKKFGFLLGGGTCVAMRRGGELSGIYTRSRVNKEEGPVVYEGYCALADYVWR